MRHAKLEHHRPYGKVELRTVIIFRRSTRSRASGFVPAAFRWQIEQRQAIATSILRNNCRSLMMLELPLRADILWN